MTTTSTPAASTTRMTAGGRATEAGMAFQAEVGTWLAVHILVRLPVGGRFSINNQAVPVALRLETGGALDDIEITQSDRGALHFQCKTSASLSDSAVSPLGKTVGQAAMWVASEKAVGDLPSVTSNAAVLAVRSNSPKTLDVLEAGCRAFDSGGDWAATRAGRNQAERNALTQLAAAARPAWIAFSGLEPQDADLVDLARIFHVARFSMDEGESDWREASRLLGGHLYGGDARGDAPLRDLKGIVRNLIGSGAPADRAGLLRLLRQRGHIDIGSPGFDDDIARLRDVTEIELGRLAVHRTLPLGTGIPITRECTEPLATAILNGSLLVIGEPGAGKTGALVHAATTLVANGDTVVFLSVDRFPGVAIATDLDSELELGHRLLDVLEAMPGVGRKILFIDALDAARGEQVEGVFATLIEQVLSRLAGGWTVVASIRTFDLKNGRRYRQAFAGTPVGLARAEQGLTNVRYFSVPRLSDTDLQMATAASPALAGLLASASPQLAGLLRNVFNLSLAARLLANGTESSTFAEIGTQSGLIDAYEDERLNSTSLQRAARAAAATMVLSRRLLVRKTDVEHDALDTVIGTGVLTEAGDLVSFAHHVLFDHVAARFYLQWNDPNALRAQIAGDTSGALMLAPALRFAVERMWREDGPGRRRVWQLITGVFADGVDPVLRSVALRTLVENVREQGDLAPLLARITSTPGDTALVVELRHLARFALMNIAENRVLTPPVALAWVQLAAALIATRERLLADPARLLLNTLCDHGDLTDGAFLAAFGQAARAFLELVWTASVQLASLSPIGIECVGKSFASAPGASRVLLDRILREPHFSQNADREAHWLARQIMPITRVDPSFTVEIYSALYGQMITDTSTLQLGSSRILPLTASRRQTYENSRYVLASAIGEVLSLSPYHGTRALVDAMVGSSATRNIVDADRINLGATSIELRGTSYEYKDWHQENDWHHAHDLLHHFVTFLRDCETPVFAICVEAASSEYSIASVWARILGVGAERVADVGDLLWPLLERPDLFRHIGTRRDAAKFVTAAWVSRSPEARLRFETMVQDGLQSAVEGELASWHKVINQILVTFPEETLQSERLLASRRAFQQSLIPASSGSESDGTVASVDHQALARNQPLSANVTVEPDGHVLNASEALYNSIEQTPSNSEASQLAVLWREAVALIALLDASPTIHERNRYLAWGHVANAALHVVSGASCTPGLDGMPELAEMFSVLDRLLSSQYPLSSEEAS